MPSEAKNLGGKERRGEQNIRAREILRCAQDDMDEKYGIVGGMSSLPPSTLTFLPVRHADRRTALELVFSHLGSDQRWEQIRGLENPPPHARTKELLAGAYRGEHLVGAGLAQVQPGRIVQVWLPRLVAGESLDTALKILQLLLDDFQDSNLVLAQILLESASPREEKLLRRGGFDFLAELLYLVCPESEYPEAPPPSPFQFLPDYTADPARFARLVENTYCGTKDCPRFNNLRPIEDVLESYQASGVFDPRRWFFVKEGTQDIGCLLLADHPAYDNLELLYMGVIPSARGHRGGQHIARFAQWQARQLARARLVLAVDAANQPALQMYAATGFQAWDRRRVYIKVF
jgi:mycothiol synthase